MSNTTSNAPELLDHKEWLGYLQPVGLVVSPPALLRFQVIVNRNVNELQQRLQAEVESRPEIIGREGRPRLKHFPDFVQRILGWESQDLVCITDQADRPELLHQLEVVLPEYGETLTPTYAVPGIPEPGDAPNLETWMMLIVEYPAGTDLDAAYASSDRGWHASPQVRLERLLRETGHDVGLLINGTDIRLVYAPSGETSGHVTFPVDAMCEVQGRLILGAFRMLLEADRLFSSHLKDRNLPALLKESRRYQNEVSTQLADQVLDALLELLQGFQIANHAVGGRLLETGTRQQREHIYGGLLTTLMRLVFLLYAEDRGLMPDDPIYLEHYSVSGLFERLRTDMGYYPDTMDQRYGAWAQLLSLFRLVYGGGRHGNMTLPRRHGQLFDPQTYPFLEGRPAGDSETTSILTDLPRISDGTIYRLLHNILMVGGERLSYRALDVEHIGSVYEAMMGYTVEVTTGPSIAVSPYHVMIDMADLLDIQSTDRAKELKKQTGCVVTGQAEQDLKHAKTPDDVVAALGKKISARTPRILPVGSLFLQPGEERRKTGSHYTPRALTHPIVETTLRPVLEALGDRPTPEQILALKICDPAMGSGAFLVEACRQLADHLVRSWEQHGNMPNIPPDEDPPLHARRLIAQRCLYGVDKNPFAVHLAKLSLWLATLARDHAFTFLDHALKHGDSLVGLSYKQIAYFNLEDKHGLEKKRDPQEKPRQMSFSDYLQNQVVSAIGSRQRILHLSDEAEHEKRFLWLESEEALVHARLLGDLLIYAFFSHNTSKEREAARERILDQLQANLGSLPTSGSASSQTQQHPPSEDRPQASLFTTLRQHAQELREQNIPIFPFHWEIEFPEVFQRNNPGFDAIIGNPPFLGGSKISSNFGAEYLAWVLQVHPESHGNGDLVAHFFRKAFILLRNNGCFGMIATNTIAQGDTRHTGLRWICSHGGTIYEVKRRLKWPGLAAVVVSVLSIKKGLYLGSKTLDGVAAPEITAFLFHSGGHENPKQLATNKNKSFLGSKIYGQGFTFDDTDTKGVASPITDMHRLIAKDPRNAERIFPYIGGAEVNDSPTHTHHRYVINFGDMSEQEARQWPDLMQIVEEKVKPERIKLKDNTDGLHRKKHWWLWGRYTPALFRAIAPLDRVLVISRVGQHGLFTFLPSQMIFSEQLVVFAFASHSALALLQSRPHEVWVRFFGSSLGDGLRYTPSDCFETFPFPPNWENHPALEAAGEAYYTFRADLMVRNNEGLTKTYNRFHDPEEHHPDIVRLRELHAAMDRAVLDAYGWIDIATDCEFLLDYEEDDDNEDTSKKKKPWRYRWPESIHDEVLARLLDLNQQRAQAEQIAGQDTQTSKKKGSVRNNKKPTTPGKGKDTNMATIPMFPEMSKTSSVPKKTPR